MTLLANLAIVLPVAALAASPSAQGTLPPHPAVVRIIAPERGGVAYGSGSLVGVQGEHGLVVTNWHVVRDAVGQIQVEFSDGFRSGARLMAQDKDWDLAALAIWRPSAAPIPLAAHAPRPGEPLTIAGYGSGNFRAITGRCTQYVAPGKNHPFEMVELSAGARQGDSGGPILNGRGELAGVLFGSAGGCTTGSYSGRVRWFLAKVSHEFQRDPSRSTLIASRPESVSRPPEPPSAQPSFSVRSPQPATPTFYDRWGPVAGNSVEIEESTAPVTVSIGSPAPVEGTPGSQPEVELSVDGWEVSEPDSAPAGELQTSPPATEFGPSPLEQTKTYLAVVGLVVLVFHLLRVLNRVPEV